MLKVWVLMSVVCPVNFGTGQTCKTTFIEMNSKAECALMQLVVVKAVTSPAYVKREDRMRLLALSCNEIPMFTADVIKLHKDKSQLN